MNRTIRKEILKKKKTEELKECKKRNKQIEKKLLARKNQK